MLTAGFNQMSLRRSREAQSATVNMGERLGILYNVPNHHPLSIFGTEDTDSQRCYSVEDLPWGT
jgi:hypothetical protein